MCKPIPFALYQSNSACVSFFAFSISLIKFSRYSFSYPFSTNSECTLLYSTFNSDVDAELDKDAESPSDTLPERDILIDSDSLAA